MKSSPLLRAILEWDARTTQYLRLRDDQRIWWKLMAFFSHSGDSWWWLAGLFPVWLLGIFFSTTWHRLAAVLAFSLLLEAALVLAIKFLIRRKRPEGEWGQIYRSTDPHSFPSGHAARMVLIAVLSWQYAPAWFAALLLVWAPLVCVARVMTGLHYVSDVLVGIFIGLLSGWLMLIWLPEIMPLVNSLIPFAF